MKLPAFAFNTEAMLGMLLRHGEKLVVGTLGLLAAWLAWRGIDALRFKSVPQAQTPAAVARACDETETHIERDKNPPESEIQGGTSLAETIATWRDAKVAAANDLALLDRPLFDELAKRGTPQVFPVESLHATGGIAVFSAAPADQQGSEGRGRITPYIVVTGLIPAAKQLAEYRRVFESVGFRDAKRDSPLWADYVLERRVAENGAGAGEWKPVNLAESLKAAKASDAAPIPTAFVLPAVEGLTPPYVHPLPTRADGRWGTTAFHPWLVEQLQKSAPGGGKSDPEFLMFRFIDTAVEPGKTYSYRVRCSLWNPNYNLAVQHLASPALAKQPKLPTRDSEPSPPVTIQDPVSILAETLRKADMKRLKPGWVEILVLGASSKTGGYALRALVTEPGGIANVDPKLNRVGDRRTRGEEITTQRVLVDVLGGQESRADGKTARPSEPFELLFLKPDGSFEHVTTADSQRRIDRYRGTLPVEDDSRRDVKPAQQDPGPSGPLGNPFATPPSPPAAK